LASQDTLGRGTIIANLDIFASRWRSIIDSWDERQRGRSETSHAQLFWSDLLRCFGVIPERISLFEVEADRATTGSWGSIDVFWSGVFLGEAKSVGKNLDFAYRQALDYLAGGSIAQHEWPRFVIVTDFERIRVVRQGTDSWDILIPLDQVASYVDQLVFLAGHEDVTPAEEADASIDAAAIMARLYEAMTGAEADAPVADEAATDPGQEDARVEQASVFLTRILFLLYGDDAGLWREDLFYEFVLNYTRKDGTDLGQQLHALFDTLNTPEHARNPRLANMLARFPYVNGSLFTDDNHLEYFDRQMREALLSACRFRWTRISPAVFGSMFQLVKSKEARRAAGEHYTTETNILKTIGPLFLDDLRTQADRLCANRSTTIKALREFRDQLATHLFLDPACGCGNFLVIAYREVRRIETQIIREIRKREGETGLALDATLETKLTIGQFHGIEISWWPAKIAETAMFLVDHQANRGLAAAVGQAPERLPITITAHIHHTNALHSDWDSLIPAVTGNTYIFGNPPFVGHKAKSREQREELRRVWGAHYSGALDYVSGWHAQAMRLYDDSRTGEFAYVTTNSISQGEQVPALFTPIYEQSWRIKFAHRTFAWDSDAPGKAAVHCVVVGFTRDPHVSQQLWDYRDVAGEPRHQQVQIGINGYLVDGPWVLVTGETRPISPELAPVNFGTMPLGSSLLVEPSEHPAVAADPIAAKYLRRFVGARELIYGHDRWCLWMDLLEFDPADLGRSPILKQRVAQSRQWRSEQTESGDAYKYRSSPHLFRPNKTRPTVPYVCIPRHVSETRRYFLVARFTPEVIAGDANFTLADPTGLQVAVISSSMFITWQKAVGGRIKSDLRFAKRLTWNTFPVPALSEATRQRIITAGQGVLDARDRHPHRSLADHYNPLAMDPELVKAHDRLDREVDRALGASRKLTSDQQRLELLFKNYRRLTQHPH